MLIVLSEKKKKKPKNKLQDKIIGRKHMEKLIVIIFKGWASPYLDMFF